jgi:hypothetical protein
MTILEPEGGNFYRPHMLQITSGQYWRCAHGNTAFAKHGCWRCALAAPLAWWRWHFPMKDTP